MADPSVSDASDDSEPGVEEPDRAVRVREVESGCRNLGRAPPASARLAARPRWMPPTRTLTPSTGNPVYGLRMQLYCRTGFHIAIFLDGRVRGLDIDRHPNAILEFSSVALGEVRMRGVETNLYLAMNADGHLYGEAERSAPSTVFVEYMFGQYNTYLSKHWAHMGWYVAIKKSGKVKPGSQTRWGQKATQFLPRRVNS